MKIIRRNPNRRRINQLRRENKRLKRKNKFLQQRLDHIDLLHITLLTPLTSLAMLSSINHIINKNKDYFYDHG